MRCFGLVWSRLLLACLFSQVYVGFACSQEATVSPAKTDSALKYIQKAENSKKKTNSRKIENSKKSQNSKKNQNSKNIQSSLKERKSTQEDKISTDLNSSKTQDFEPAQMQDRGSVGENYSRQMNIHRNSLPPCDLRPKDRYWVPKGSFSTELAEPSQ
jgi:predicted transcriptional regulator